MFHRVYVPPLTGDLSVPSCLWSTVSMLHHVCVPPSLCFTVSLLLACVPPLNTKSFVFTTPGAQSSSRKQKKKNKVCVWGEGGGPQCNAQSLSGKTRGGDISTHSDYNSTPCSTLLLFLEMKLKNESWEDGEHSRAYRSLQDHSM